MPSSVAKSTNINLIKHQASKDWSYSRSWRSPWVTRGTHTLGKKLFTLLVTEPSCSYCTETNTVVQLVRSSRMYSNSEIFCTLWAYHTNKYLQTMAYWSCSRFSQGCSLNYHHLLVALWGELSTTSMLMASTPGPQEPFNECVGSTPRGKRSTGSKRRPQQERGNKRWSIKK